MSGKNLIEKISRLLVDSIEALGFRLVDIEVRGSTDLTLQIFIERLSGEPLVVEDCAIVSRHISAILDVEDLIESSYVLEVSSPGIDKNLHTVQDFQTYLGFEARVKVIERVENRRNFRGRIVAAEEDMLTIRVENVEYKIALSNIEKAKLILTDDLIAFSNDSNQTKH